MSDRIISPSVYGVETEYSCLVTMPGSMEHEIVGSCHSVDAKLGLFEQPKKSPGGIYDSRISTALRELGVITGSNGMLSNGGRLYMDPSGPEYATPETATAEDAVLRTFEGDRLVLGVFGELRKVGAIEGFQVNRRGVDHNRTSRGTHLNTTTKLNNKAPSDQVVMWLATLNVAKGSLFGSGGLLLDQDGNTAFHHSPRLSITGGIESGFVSWSKRPLVRTPFKPDGRRGPLGRIETISSDALNFGWPLRASLVMSNVVVGLIEMGYGDRLPMLLSESALISAQSVGEYGAQGLMVLEQRRGKSSVLTSLNVLRQIAETVMEVDQTQKQLDKESAQVVQEVIDIADKMANDSHSVADQVESVARWTAMQRKMEKDGLPIDSERMCRFDYAWDWIGGGIAETLRSKGKIGWQGFGPLPSVAATKKRMMTPPSNTRAHIRGNIIGVEGDSNTSSWADIDFGRETRYLHPLSTTVPEGIESPIDL